MGLFRPPTPPIQFNSREKNGGGDRVRKKRFKGMELPVPVTIRSKEKIEFLKEDMSNWLVQDEAKRLIFKDKPDRYYLAYYQDMDLDERINYAKGTITFYLPTAYRFGSSEELNIKTTFESFTITGQASSPWTSKTTFKDSADQYILETNKGGKIVLNYDFVSGDVLRVDYNNRSVTLNEKNLDVSIALATQWFKLEPGLMSLRASHETEILYNETYY